MDAEHARRGGIDAVKIVQQPAVGAELAEQVAQGGKIEFSSRVIGGEDRGPAARHSQPSRRAPQSTCTIAPS